jgi:hypothetical protein
MPDEELFRDLDTPRALPADVRGRLEETLLGRNPRALPEDLSRRLAGRLARPRRRPPWWAGAAAAALLVAGVSLAVLAGSGGGARPSHTAARTVPPSGAAGAAAQAAPSQNLSRPSAEAVLPGGVPVVDSLAPTVGPTGGGTWVTITGTRLAGVSAVFFGNVPAQKFAVVSSSQIRALSPPHTAGAVPVEVSGPAGRSAAGTGSSFTYEPGHG